MAEPKAKLAQLLSKGLIAIIIAAALFFMAVLALYFLLGEERRVGASMERKKVAIENAQAALTCLRDIETSHRGFVITGYEDYLAPQVGASEKLKATLARLEEYFANDPAELNRVRELRSMADKKLAYSQTLIELRRQNQRAALDMVKGGEGKLLMDRSRQLEGEIVQCESNALDEMESERKNLVQSTNVSVFVLALTATAILAWLFIAVKQHLEARTADELKLKEALSHRTTELKASNEALLEQERLFRLVFDTMPQIAWSARPDGYVEYYNQTYYTFTGESPESVAGWGWEKVLDPAQLPEVKGLWLRALELGTAFEVQFRLRRNDGQYRWFAGRANPILNEQGKVFRWVGIGTDIEEERKAAERLEAQVEARSRELKLSELRFQGIFDNTFQFTGLMSPDGIVQEANETALKFIGAKRDQVVGRALVDTPWFNTSRGEQEKLKDAVALAARGEFVRYEAQITGLKEEITVDFSLKPLRDEKGDVIMLIYEGRDISALIAAKKELERTASLLERSNKDLQQFAYVASHDLQEPLRTVTSFCDLLSRRSQGRLDSDGEKFLQIIIENTERMKQMVKDLLAYARVEQQGNPLAITPLTVPLQQAIESLSTAIGENNVSINYKDLPTVLGDKTQLSALFQNLISNSIKFGREKVEIEITAAKPDGQRELWQISFKDNGIGFNMNYAEKIFIIFQRLHSRTKYSGTGIGLAVCKRIVERHGGKIWAESEPGQGATFHFTLMPADRESGDSIFT